MTVFVVHRVAKFGIINPILKTINVKSQLERYKISLI